MIKKLQASQFAIYSNPHSHPKADGLVKFIGVRALGSVNVFRKKGIKVACSNNH